MEIFMCSDFFYLDIVLGLLLVFISYAEKIYDSYHILVVSVLNKIKIYFKLLWIF